MSGVDADLPGGAPVELSVVLPTYDEAATIERVVRDVVTVARRLAPDSFEVVVIDDGSTDATGGLLDSLAGEIVELDVRRLRVNRGHGPALLVGYRAARGRWVAHLDTDDQVPADQLESLWARRHDGDLVLGVRTERDDPRHRLVISVVLRSIVGRLAGRSVRDANVPAKVISADLLGEALPRLGADAFAPSIGVAIIAARTGRSIVEVPIAHRARPHGTSTLKPLRLAYALVVSARQNIAVARALR